MTPRENLLAACVAKFLEQQPETTDDPELAYLIESATQALSWHRQISGPEVEALLDEVWVVRELKDNVWWRGQRAGYCAELVGAGAYSEAEAKDCASNRPEQDQAKPLREALAGLSPDTVGATLLRTIQDLDARTYTEVQKARLDARLEVCELLRQMPPSEATNAMWAGRLARAVSVNGEDVAEAVHSASQLRVAAEQMIAKDGAQETT